MYASLFILRVIHYLTRNSNEPIIMNKFTAGTVTEGVRIWEERVIIPTYQHGEPNKNPMFLEKRVYQGSSGTVYPHPVIDKIHDKKT